MPAPILVVSGGSESVSVSITEWARSSGREIVVYSLIRRSLLEGLPCVGQVRSSPSGGREVVLADLASFVAELGAGHSEPVIGFATEDDSLGLLLELCEGLGQAVLACSRCRALPGGGLDKASLFTFLQAAGLENVIAETITLSSEADVSAAQAALGESVILKPACKPWAGTLDGGAKVHSGAGLSAANRAIERERDFQAAKSWVAQRRLGPLRGGERSACIVRDAQGAVLYAEVVEWLKYPALGGTACIVESQPDEHGLREATMQIVEALDVIGVVELSFLADEAGRPRLLELNVRPWLQIDLLQSCGFDLLGAAEVALKGGELSSTIVPLRRRTWISIERLLAKLVTGDGGRWLTLREMIAAMARWPVISVWSSSLPGIRLRWARRILLRVVR